jgi:multiple sugar transport system permease protein
MVRSSATTPGQAAGGPGREAASALSAPGGRSAPVPRFTARFRNAIEKRFFVFMSAPGFIVVAAVTFIPICAGIYLSFTNYMPTDPSLKFAGLLNYRQLLHDSEAHQAIVNTLVFAGVGLAIEMTLGVSLALMLARPMRGIRVFRTLFILPLMVAGIASAIAWRSLLNTSMGWGNYFLSVIGLPQPNWLASPHTAMASVILADVWSGAPTVAIIVLAGLLVVPKEPVEAACIDGASSVQIFWHITLPALQPVLAFAAIFRLVDLFRNIALFQIMTGGGPGLSTSVLNFFVYQTTFVYGELGYGAALAVVLVVLMAIPLLIIFRFARRRS